MPIRLATLFSTAVVLAISTCSISNAAIITADFHATNRLPFSIFEFGDTVTGTFSYDNSIFTGGSVFVSEQNAPVATLSLIYTELSTGRTATARSDAAANILPDLGIRVSSNAIDVNFEFSNFTTDPNTVFGGSGISFDEVFVRFKTIVEVVAFPEDLSNLTPTFLTMLIGFNSRTFGPNFDLDSVRQTGTADDTQTVPEPSGLALLAIGGIFLQAVRRRRWKTIARRGTVT